MIVILQNIRSAHNVGSIFRTADAAGVSKIYLCGITPAPLDKFNRENKKILKISLGAEKFVQWEKIGRAAPLMRALQKNGFRILAIEQSKDSTPYYKFKSRGDDKNIALVLGGEIRGLSSGLLKLADRVLEIPMRDKMVREANHPRHTKIGKESLNVSVAFGIVLFHILYS